MHRFAAILLFTVGLAACNASDATLGVDATLKKDPGGGPSTTLLSRVDLGTLGGASSYAADINAGNTVVGWSETASGATHAFRWSRLGGMVDLGTLPGDAESRAVAVLDGAAEGSERILGLSGRDGRWTPVVWTNSSASIKALPIPLTPGFTTALPTDFNARGDVVGSDANGFQHGWIWSDSHGKLDLSASVTGGSNEGSANAITASGLVVLTTRANTCHSSVSCWRTYLWTEKSGYSGLGTPNDAAEADVTGFAVSETGAVAGGFTPGVSGGTTPYRWREGSGFTLLENYPAGGYGYATALTTGGTAVGASLEPGSGSIVASMWGIDGRIIRLSPEDPNPSVAIAINEGGTIAGWAAVSAGGNHAVVWTPVTQASQVTMRAPTSVNIRIMTASAPCLTDSRSTSSRQALFACVVKADRSH